MALKNIMRVDNGNVLGADIEARNFINNNLITDVNGTDVEFKFIYDSTSGKFGYRDASGTFVPFESGGDFSQLIYENLAAANIKKGVTINVKDPDGNLLNGATGSYEVNTFTNLTDANIKNGTTVTIKDSTGATVKSVTGNFKGSIIDALATNITLPYTATADCVVIVAGIAEYAQGNKTDSYGYWAGGGSTATPSISGGTALSNQAMAHTISDTYIYDNVHVRGGSQGRLYVCKLTSGQKVTISSQYAYKAVMLKI